MARYSHERKQAVLNKLLPPYNLTVAKLATVIETATLSEAQLSAYCREKGLYPDQVKRWKEESLQGFERSAEQEKALRKQAQNDRQEIKKLQRELRRKDKALAEAAALLVLRKKLNALWDNSDSNEEE